MVHYELNEVKGIPMSDEQTCYPPEYLPFLSCFIQNGTKKEYMDFKPAITRAINTGIELQNHRPEAWEDADQERTLSDGTWIKEGYDPGGHGVVYEFWIVPR